MHMHPRNGGAYTDGRSIECCDVRMASALDSRLSYRQPYPAELSDESPKARESRRIDKARPSWSSTCMSSRRSGWTIQPPLLSCLTPPISDAPLLCCVHGAVAYGRVPPCCEMSLARHGCSLLLQQYRRASWLLSAAAASSSVRRALCRCECRLGPSAATRQPGEGRRRRRHQPGCKARRGGWQPASMESSRGPRIGRSPHWSSSMQPSARKGVGKRRAMGPKQTGARQGPGKGWGRLE